MTIDHTATFTRFASSTPDQEPNSEPVDISFIHDNLPGGDETSWLLKERLDILNTESYIFTFAKSISSPHETLELGLAKDVNSCHRVTEKYNKFYLDCDIVYLIDGLALGIINQCKEHNKKEVTILLPEPTLEKCYLSTYMQEDRVILAANVRIYFDN